MKMETILLALMLSWGTPAAWAADAVIGTLSYPAGAVLPSGATVDAELLDEFSADAPNVIAHREIAAIPPPKKIVLKVDTATIQGNHPYIFLVAVKSGGQYLFYAPQKYPVLTFGHSSNATVDLAPVPQPTANKPYGPALEETYWRLSALGGTPVTTGSVREPYLRLSSFNSTLSGTGGCNRFRGGYEVSGQSVIFKDVGRARMGCPKGTNSDDAFLKALQAARKWQITEDRMDLLDEKSGSVASFRGIPPQPLIGGK